MKVSQSITGKYNYTELKVASEGEGSVVLNGKRSDNGAKVIIFGQHVPSESNKKRQSSNSKTTFSVPSSQYMQKCIQRPFLAAIDAENSEDAYYLMPLKFYKNSLQGTLSSYTFPQRIQIAYKLAKGVWELHNENGVYHGSLDLSRIIVKKQDEVSGYTVKMYPPIHPKIQESLQKTQKQNSIYSIAEQELTKRSDIWSLGLIFFELFTGHEISVKQQIKQSPHLLKDFEFGINLRDIKQSQSVQKLLKSMLVRAVDRRVSIDDVLETLKREALRQLYGQEFTIPLINQQKENQKNYQREMRAIVTKGTDESRVILKNFVLVMKLINSTRLNLSLHLKQNFKAFMSIEYYFTQLPQPIQQAFKNLPNLFKELSKKDKRSIRFATNGALTIYHKSAQ